MKTLGRFMTINGLLLLVLAGPSAAAVLYTPLMQLPPATAFECRAVNVTSRPVSVTIDLIDSSANVLATNSCTFPPGAELCVASSGAAGVAYCRFSVSGSRRSVRAAIYTTDANGQVAVLPAE